MRTFLVSWLIIMGCWVGKFSGVTVGWEIRTVYFLLGVGLALAFIQDIKEIMKE